MSHLAHAPISHPPQNAGHSTGALRRFHLNAAIQTVTDAHTETARYARCIKASKKAPWEIDRDVLRGRKFDFGH